VRSDGVVAVDLILTGWLGFHTSTERGLVLLIRASLDGWAKPPQQERVRFVHRCRLGGRAYWAHDAADDAITLLNPAQRLQASISGDLLSVSGAGISGTTIVAGAPGTNNSTGTAYMYTMPTNGWASTSTPAAELTASDGAADDDFGRGVGISGTTIIASAIGHNVFGTVYVYQMGGNAWASSSTPTAEIDGNGTISEIDFGLPTPSPGPRLSLDCSNQVGTARSRSSQSPSTAPGPTPRLQPRH
jgi:hypothetical protein